MILKINYNFITITNITPSNKSTRNYIQALVKLGELSCYKVLFVMNYVKLNTPFTGEHSDIDMYGVKHIWPRTSTLNAVNLPLILYSVSELVSYND